MTSTLRKEKGKWYLYFRCLPGCAKHPEGRRRHHVCLHVRDQQAATTLQREFDTAQAEQWGRVQLGLPVSGRRDPLSQSAEAYWRALGPEKSPASIERAERPAVHDLLTQAGDWPLAEYTVERVLDYRASALMRHKPATWNSRRRILRALWNWFGRQGWVSGNPWREVGAVKEYEDEHRLQPVDQSRIPDLLAVAPDRDWQLIVLFLYQSWCRLGELLHLRRDDVLWEQGLIRFRLPKERHGQHVRYKYVALTEDLAALIREAERRCASEYVFSRREREGRPLSARKVHYMLAKMGARIGLKVSPHRLRKSGPTHALGAGADIRTIQQILGHADIRTTATYLRPNPAHQAAALMTLPGAHLRTIKNTQFQATVLQQLRAAQAARRKPKLSASLSARVTPRP